MEAELGGSFIKLRQALFQLNSVDSSLLFTVVPVPQFCGKYNNAVCMCVILG